MILQKLSHYRRIVPRPFSFQKIPLRTVLVVPFVAQIFAAVGLTGYLSFRNGQQAVENLAAQLQQEIAMGIQQQINIYLEVPRVINQVNASAIQRGQLNVQDLDSFSRQFWEQRFLFQEVNGSAFYYGTAEGEFVGLGLQSDRTWKIGRSGQSTDGRYTFVGADNRGNPTQVLEVGEPYDPRVRPWYVKAVEAGKPIWSDIYLDFKEKRLKITFSQPVYNSEARLLGVVGVDFVLSHIKDYLKDLKVAESGQIFIIDRAGKLIATSLPINPFIVRGKDVRRLEATEVEAPLIRQTARALQSRFGDFRQIRASHHLKIRSSGQWQFVQVMPFSGGENLDWLIVVAIPESNFMAQIDANTRNTIVLCLVALAIATSLGILAARWIARPIYKLVKASGAIADGQFEQNLRIEGIEELEGLARAFERMSSQLQQSNQQLADYSHSLEEKVNERTQALQQEISERQLLEEKLRSSELEIRAFFDAMSDIVLLVDVDLQNIKVAPTNPARFDLNGNNLLQLTLDCFLGDRASEFRRPIQQAIATQQIVNFEYRFRIQNPKSKIQNPEEVWFAARISPISENMVAWVARDISDRKRIEEELHLSEEKFAKAFRATPHPVTITSLTDKKHLEVNDAFLELTGYDREEVLGRNALELNLWVDLEARDRFFQILTNEGEARNYEFKFRTKSGQIRTALLSAEIIYLQRKPCLLSVSNDITARKQAEEALQQSEAKYRDLVETANCIILRWDTQGRVVFLNDYGQQFFGYEEAEIVGCNVIGTIVPETESSGRDLQELMKDICLHPERYQANENENVRKNGDRAWLTWSNKPIFSDRGELVEILSIGIDITQRKQAEQALERRAEADSLLSGISRAFLDRDLDTAIELALQAVGEFTQSDVCAILRFCQDLSCETKSYSWQAEDGNFVPRWQGANIQESSGFRDQLLDGEVVSIPRSGDATTENCESLLYVPTIHLGKVIGAIGLEAARSPRRWTSEEINLLELVGEIVAIGFVRHEAEAAQKRAIEAAIAASKAKSEFLANMSHELRTPLTAILGLSEVLREEVFGPLTAKQHQKLATIEQSGQHLLELINDILDLAKIESGKMELQLAPIDIQGLCNASLAFVRQQAHQKQIQLSASVPPDAGKVLADERRMRQVLINLLSNAVKFTPDGGAVWVEVQTDANNEVLQFNVVDTGIGIASEDLGKLFQPFVQLDSSFTRRYTGTGLGLALVRQVVELHGGSIAIESEVGRGSRFTVVLPWQPETKVRAKYWADNVTDGFPQKHPMLCPHAPDNPILETVLIVEDCTPAAEQIARYLTEDFGTRHPVVHLLGTGTVERAIAIAPDAIILDLQLPDRSGWDVLAQLRAEPRAANIPVLIVSVVDRPLHSDIPQDCEYLVKPFSRSEFQLAIRKLCTLGSNTETTPSQQTLPTILVAEDNPANLSTIVEYLEIQGYRVAIANNGREAVQMTQDLQPDLVLMDIQMPEMDGLEATRQIRALGSSASPPIIALTALTMPGDREKCLAAGADEYLAKPVSLKKLVEAIALHLKP